jgi:7-cyano-7-deazaguanine synthase
VELECRQSVLGEMRKAFPAWSSRLGEDHLLEVDALRELGATALTHEVEIRMQEAKLPNTFVPGRNIVFFTLAAALAYRRDIRVLVGGMCETDFSGYPDCRDDTIKAVQVALSLGMDTRFTLETPLMWLDKAATWKLAETLGGAELIRITVEHTHTCYLGDRQHKHAWGHGCGRCPACELRKKGYAAYSAT